MVASAVVAAVLVHRRFVWVPVEYLAAIVGAPTVGWRVARRRSVPSVARLGTGATAALAVVALMPIPWMQAAVDDPPGTAWRLDGRVEINGVTVDDPGTWYWLTVGRPPMVAEVVRGWFASEPGDAPVSMVAGRQVARPAVSEPAAAAVGLRRAGWPIATRLMVEVSGPFDGLLPARATLSSVNGVGFADRSEWQSILDHLGDDNSFTTTGGETFTFHGREMPYRRIDVIELPDGDLDVAVGGLWARTLPGAWYRNLSTGSSHGLMVALVAYVHGSGDDLARGRAIAGTGRILPDGTVGTISGLRAKATAARDAGADVLLLPASQIGQLEGFDAAAMRVMPVTSLDDAIAALSR